MPTRPHPVCRYGQRYRFHRLTVGGRNHYMSGAGCDLLYRFVQVPPHAKRAVDKQQHLKGLRPLNVYPKR